MKGIICDVGHTIITDSILNEILLHEGKTDAVASLYDEDLLAGKDDNAIDEWVTKVSSYKINRLRGVSIDRIGEYCRSAKLTPGFKSFVSQAISQEIPILFVGAVPEIITRYLLRYAGVTFDSSPCVSVRGSEIQVINNLIDRPLKICTPGVKKQYARLWLKNHELTAHDVVVIGDSLGDIPVMKLAVQANRYGIHVSSSGLRKLIAREIKDFNELSGLVNTDNNRMMEIS